MSSFVEFEFEREGEIYTIHGVFEWVGERPPIEAPNPDCPKCHGEGAVKVGWEPPDEFNATGEDIYDGCDCAHDVPGSGRPGWPTINVTDIEAPDGEWLSEDDVIVFVAKVGRKALAEAADEALCACQG
jgi:hypothetical protein